MGAADGERGLRWAGRGAGTRTGPRGAAGERQSSANSRTPTPRPQGPRHHPQWDVSAPREPKRPRQNQEEMMTLSVARPGIFSNKIP